MNTETLALPTTITMGNGEIAVLNKRFVCGSTLGHFTNKNGSPEPALWDKAGFMTAGNHIYFSSAYDLVDNEKMAREGWNKLDHTMQDVLLIAGRTQKILAIKKTRELTGMGLTLSKYAIENFQPTYGY